MENKDQMEKEINTAVNASMGFDELEITAIEKFGTELCIKTDKGDFFIPARKFFDQREFRIRAFETLGILLQGVKNQRYNKWMEQWATLIKDLKADDNDLIETAEDSIKEHLSKTNETDLEYLEAGRPVLLDNGHIAFRSGELHTFLKKENIQLSTDQLYFILKRMGCEAKQIGKSRTRVWILKN